MLKKTLAETPLTLEEINAVNGEDHPLLARFVLTIRSLLYENARLRKDRKSGKWRQLFWQLAEPLGLPGSPSAQDAIKTAKARSVHLIESLDRISELLDQKEKLIDENARLKTAHLDEHRVPAHLIADALLHPDYAVIGRLMLKLPDNLTVRCRNAVHGTPGQRAWAVSPINVQPTWYGDLLDALRHAVGTE